MQWNLRKFTKPYNRLLTACASQGFILGQLLFLTQINDLSDNLQCSPKLFTDETLLLSTFNPLVPGVP